MGAGGAPPRGAPVEPSMCGSAEALLLLVVVVVVAVVVVVVVVVVVGLLFNSITIITIITYDHIGIIVSAEARHVYRRGFASKLVKSRQNGVRAFIETRNVHGYLPNHELS